MTHSPSLFCVLHSVWKSPKISHLNFGISTNFWPIKTDLSGNSVWLQALGFQKFAKLDHFWHFFNELLSTQNVNVARFALNVEWNFFCDFQTPCHARSFIVWVFDFVVSSTITPILPSKLPFNCCLIIVYVASVEAATLVYNANPRQVVTIEKN